MGEGNLESFALGYKAASPPGRGLVVKIINGGILFLYEDSV